MGIPVASALAATPTPASGDQANLVVSGSFAVAGACSLPVGIYGNFDVTVWGEQVGSLQTFAGLAVASINFGATQLVREGASVRGTNVPAGASLILGSAQVLGLQSVQLGGLSATQILALTAATDAAAVATVVPTATVALEKSYDGGFTWIPASVPGTVGTPIIFVLGTTLTQPVSIRMGEPEKGVYWRLNCRNYTAGGTVNYRISTTGNMAQSAAALVS